MAPRPPESTVRVATPLPSPLLTLLVASRHLHPGSLSNLPDDGHCLYLDEEPWVYEGGDLDHRGRWIGRLKVAPPDLVDLIVEPHVPYEDGYLDYVVHPAAGLLDHSLHVLEHRLRLTLYVSLTDHVPIRVHRDLPRDIDRTPRRSLDPRGERTPTHRRRQPGTTNHTPRQNDHLVFWFLSTIGRCGRGRSIPPWSRASLGDRRKAGITAPF